MNFLTTHEMQTILGSVLTERLALNAGISIIYEDGQGKIGVSLENSYEDGYDRKVGPVYIFNIFFNGEYINIDGQYTRDDLLNGGPVGKLADTWNKYVCRQKTSCKYPELAMYDEEDYRLDLTRDDPEIDGPDFEVVFDVGDERYYCFLHGTGNLLEALGLFFRSNPHITYEMIFEHMEV